jgi:4-alpha-glucanotransferase
MNIRRCSGVLLHPTSLPSPWGVGDLGPSAYKFVDQIAAAGQKLWQMLPLAPVGAHGSPYSPHSLLAGNPLLISPEFLAKDGYLDGLPPPPEIADARRVDYPASIALKDRLLERAFAHSFGGDRTESAFADFCGKNEAWLDDFALYDALTRAYGRPWTRWPEDFRRKEAGAIEKKVSSLLPSIQRAKFSQFLFDRQWNALREYAASKGIRILGDVPFYVLHDSSDVWSNQDLFKLDGQGNALFVGGVPPDYFSKTGQRWGNPVYDWTRMEQTGYRWWKARAVRGLGLSDLLRLDHFRGYVAYWEIPEEAPTAETGRWVHVPSSFFAFVKDNFPDLPFVAEDLGVITDDVRAAIQALGIPGMRVLQFAFDGHRDNPHLPQNHVRNSLVCTGTHDTNTTRGWFVEEATQHDREVLEDIVGHRVSPDSVCSELMGMAMSSSSDICIIPFQDVLGLGGEARMNNPSVSEGNWRWRAMAEETSDENFKRLGELTASSGRS